MSAGSSAADPVETNGPIRDKGDGAAMDRAVNARLFRVAQQQPMLSREAESALARRAITGDAAAAEELVASHLRFVIRIARGYRNYGLPMNDLVQEGVIGLLQAVRKFNPDRNVRFATYAMWWVRAAMQDHVVRSWSLVRVGTTAAQKALFFNLRRLRARINEDTGGQLSQEGREYIATELNVPMADVESMEVRLGSSDQSLNAPLAEEGEGNWQDFLADTRPTPEEVVTGLRDAATRSRWLNEALRELSAREQTIIRERRLQEEGATLEELGKELGVSKERVRQLEQRAMEKLRSHIERRIEHRPEEPGDLMVEMVDA